MKLSVIDKSGKKISELELEKSVFGQEVNQDLLAQYVHVFRTNQRQGTTSTKTRAEVSGGGKKPWRQKGTGRARHGSIRSPIWAHGGVAHGPKPKDYSLKLPKKMKKKAMQHSLSYKLSQGNIKVVDKIDISKPGTKNMKQLLDSMELTDKTLIVIEKPNENIRKSVANLPQSSCIYIDSLNVYDLMDTDQVLFEKEALVKLQEKYK